eukprot:10706019-Alexandrium_andersonii.AAC.1
MSAGGARKRRGAQPKCRGRPLRAGPNAPHACSGQGRRRCPKPRLSRHRETRGPQQTPQVVVPPREAGGKVL